MRVLSITLCILVCAAPGFSQSPELKTAGAVLERYQQALGGPRAIQRVQAEVVRGEVESSNGSAEPVRAEFVYYAKPFRTLYKVTHADGRESTFGFDGKVFWALTDKGAEIDRETPIDAIRRDADLQYAMHQPDYFKTLALAGVQEFAGQTCYWLHGTTRWGKDNNQFYDVKTGLLVGYRFQSDSADAAIATEAFDDYKNFDGLMVATKRTSRTGDHVQVFWFKSLSYEPVADSTFALPQAVKALLQN